MGSSAHWGPASFFVEASTFLHPSESIRAANMNEFLNRAADDCCAEEIGIVETRKRIERLGHVITEAMFNATVVETPGFRELSPASLGAIIRRFTNKAERSFLFDATFIAMDDDGQFAACEHLWAAYHPNMPIPALYDCESEASVWATFTPLKELMAYMAAIWQRLPRQVQDKFLRNVEARRSERPR